MSDTWTWKPLNYNLSTNLDVAGVVKTLQGADPTLQIEKGDG